VYIHIYVATYVFSSIYIGLLNFELTTWAANIVQFDNRNTPQHIATCCSTPQSNTSNYTNLNFHSNILHYTATHHNTLQHAAAHLNPINPTTHTWAVIMGVQNIVLGVIRLRYVAECCSVLQCVAVCYSVLQCVAVCCSVWGSEYCSWSH